MTVQLAISTPSRDFSQRANAPWTRVGLETPETPVAGCAMRFEQDREIYGEGEESSCYYTVISGVVRTCKFLSDGRRQIDAFHVAGDVFGIEPGTLRSLSAEAVSDCRVMVHRSPHLDKSDVPGAVSPQLFADVLRNLVRAQEHTVLLGRRSAVEKVAAFLLGWAQQSASACTVALAMTRHDIGDYLGLTIETVSRTLSQLERDRIIELPSVRQIKITDLEALIELNH
jgi:CRP/FNR family nitrogen fixation transcriptional regulator